MGWDGGWENPGKCLRVNLRVARRTRVRVGCGMWIVDVDARTASLLRVVLAWPVRRPAAAAAVRASAVQKCPPTTHQFLTVVPVPRPSRHATKQSSSQAVPHNETKRPDDTHSRAPTNVHRPTKTTASGLARPIAVARLSRTHATGTRLQSTRASRIVFFSHRLKERPERNR